MDNFLLLGMTLCAISEWLVHTAGKGRNITMGYGASNRPARAGEAGSKARNCDLQACGRRGNVRASLVEATGTAVGIRSRDAPEAAGGLHHGVGIDDHARERTQSR